MQDPAARYLHPSNLLTYVAVLAAFAAVLAAHRLQSWSAAGGLIALSATADTFDGRFARLFERSAGLKKFGGQLDSLADGLSFGLVPVVCLSLLLPLDTTPLFLAWFAAASFYVIGAITRLGVYNLQPSPTDGFVGLPTTLAGLIWSSAFIVEPSAALCTGLLVLLGIAMVSSAAIPRPRGWVMGALVGWQVVLLVVYGGWFVAA